MSRFEGSERILAAAESWKQVCLLDEGSLFSEHGLWTRGNFEELRRLFVENPDDSKDPSFLDRLERQLEPGSQDAKCLWAEMVWVYRLIVAPGSVAADTKRQQIARVWGWSGRKFPEGHDLVSRDVLGVGVVDPGPAYNSYAWLEYRFFVDSMWVWFSLDRRHRNALLGDPWGFAEWLDGTEHAENRAFRHAMLFLLFPDNFEPIVSSRNKVKIVTTLHDGGVPEASNTVALDRALVAVRERLEEDNPGFHFYHSPVRELWQGETGDLEVAEVTGKTTTTTAARRPPSASLNTILYGPPGTGKTYRTASRCVHICDGRVFEGDALRERYDALMAEGRVRFVTFHQSYGYEEFVEGIRPVEQDGQIVYRVEPGILKSLANAARDASATPDKTSAGLTDFDALFETLRDGPLPKAVETKRDRVEYIMDKIAGVDALQFTRQDKRRRVNRDELARLWDNLSKTPNGLPHPDQLTTSRIVDAVDKGADATYIWIAYRELYGLMTPPSAPGTGSPAAETPAFVLVIDEINRANISKVMGELITLLEEDKREGAANEVTVTLPHSRELFTLPPNLHVLGTMNTADRSIALLDTALRRRFDFEEVAPEPSQLADAGRRTGVDLPRVLTVINERLEYLVDRDHLIGHAWLMGARDRASLDDIMRRKVIPLIAEYFYDDWNNVRAVLGGSDAFVERVVLRAPPGVEPEVSERYRWTVRSHFPTTAYEDLLTRADVPEADV